MFIYHPGGQRVGVACWKGASQLSVRMCCTSQNAGEAHGADALWKAEGSGGSLGKKSDTFVSVLLSSLLFVSVGVPYLSGH